MKMAKKFSKRVENTVGKGEIARNEKFLLLPQCFQKTFTADTSRPGPVWERVNIDFKPIKACVTFKYSFFQHKLDNF